MLTLNVPDMTCGHCASRVTKTLKEVDGAAAVTIDLAAQKVTVETNADAETVKAALAAAGYPAQAA